MDKSIVFVDFDGVLVDSFKVALDIARRIRPGMTVSGLKELFRGNFFEEARKRGVDVSAEDIERARAAATQRIEGRRPVEGISEAVRQIGETHALYIISSSGSGAIRRYLSDNGLDDIFSGVLGADAGLSKSEKMRKVLLDEGVDAGNAVMVTDTLGDIREATETKTRSIAVTWGFHDETTLREGEPAAMISSPEELVATVDRLLSTSDAETT